jgi:hypothetical protein
MGGGAGLVALLMALPSALPPAVANEEPARTLLSNASEIFPPPFDPNDLLKWEYTVEPSVSTEVQRQSTIRKIGYGNTEFVQILETPSGTYSTDGLTSPNVDYPGIHKKPSAYRPGFRVWIDGHWQLIRPVSANSFVTVMPFEGGQLVVTDDGACVIDRHGRRC